MKKEFHKLTVLSSARKRITDPDHWTQHTYSKTKTGKETVANSRYADKWCAIGAVRKCLADLYPGTAQYRKGNFEEILRSDLNRAAVQWTRIHAPDQLINQVTHANDHLDHTSILAIFDLAIATLHNEESPS